MRELGKVDYDLNWAMLNYMIEEGVLDKGVEIREGSVEEVKRRGDKR